MPSYLSHLITDPSAHVTVEFARQCEAVKAATPANVRAARKAELAAAYTRTPLEPKAPVQRAAPCGPGVLNEDLREWWGEGPGEGVPLTAAVRQAAQAFPGIGRADFIATLVSKGVNKATAGIQFKKGRDGDV